MEIIYSEHAKKRMSERNIEEWEVEHAVNFPTSTKKSHEGKIEATAELRNRAFTVVYIKEENYIKIVTVL